MACFNTVFAMNFHFLLEVGKKGKIIDWLMYSFYFLFLNVCCRCLWKEKGEMRIELEATCLVCEWVVVDHLLLVHARVGHLIVGP